MASSDVFRGRFKELEAMESQKNDLINDLLARLDDLRGQRDEAKSDLETEREARRRLQRSIRDSNPTRLRFAVLILHLDGDVFLFDDKWMQRDPAAGGERIAGEMVDKVKDFLKNCTQIDDSADVQIIVKVYGDLFKLWRTYEAAKANLGTPDLTRFFSHFNRRDGLVDFVDFGPRTGSIEKKLSGVLSHYLQDDRIEHILFGSPHYSIPPILDAHLPLPLNSSSAHYSRFTLLTVPPVPKDWDDFGLRTTSHFNSFFIIPPEPNSNPIISILPTRSSSQAANPSSSIRVRSPPTRFKPPKEHHKAPPPTAPNPPSAVGPNVNVSRLRTRKDSQAGAWMSGDDRSLPPSSNPFSNTGAPNPFANPPGNPNPFVGNAGNPFMNVNPNVNGPYSPGRGAPMGMQMTRRETFPNPGMRYPGVPPEAPNVPGWQ